ncbi:MAG: hypothetical protein ABR886_01045 [Dehalococcoidales bacterium]|jgi:hypothetical protein
MKWLFQRKKPEAPQEQKQLDPQQSLYVGSNLDALQERVAKIVIGLGILHHQPTFEWIEDVRGVIRRIQDQAKDYGSEVTKLLGEREVMLVAGKEMTGSTYPIIAIIPDVVLPNACMLWVPGDENFYRVIAYYGEGFDNNRRFDGNTLVFDEGLFTGSGHYCCKVDPWGRSDKLHAVPTGPDDPLLLNDPLAGWVVGLFSCLQTQIPPRCKVPIVTGKSSDRSTWKWCNEARGLRIIVLGNMV